MNTNESQKKNETDDASNKNNKNTVDPRKHPKPGYDEKNTENKKNIQDHPGDQNTG